MKKSFLPLFMMMTLPLTACGTGPMYELAYRAVDKLQTIIEDANRLFVHHAYYGDPPTEVYGTLALIVFSTPNEVNVRVMNYFGYENDDKYYLWLDAVGLYDYRNYYYELDNFKINDHYGFKR